MLPSLQWCNVFYGNINVHLPKCLNRHHNDNEDVLTIVYCELHTSTFTVSQKTQNNIHPSVSAMQHNLVSPHPVMSVFTSQLPAFSPDVCAAWCRHQVPRYLLSYTDIYISRYLHIYRYLHTRCLHHQISYILLGTVEEASAGLQSRPRDLLPCFCKPEQSGAGRGQILADC